MRDSTKKYGEIMKGLRIINRALVTAHCNYGNLCHWCKTELDGEKYHHEYRMPPIIKRALKEYQRETMESLATAREEISHLFSDIVDLKNLTYWEARHGRKTCS